MTKSIDKVVEIDSLVHAKIIFAEIAKNSDYAEVDYSKIVVSNSSGSIYYLGIKVIHFIFKQLEADYNITKFIVQAEDDHAAVLSAIELGYKRIEYRGESHFIKNLIKIMI